jgi:hypothetical protein
MKGNPMELPPPSLPGAVTRVTCAAVHSSSHSVHTDVNFRQRGALRSACTSMLVCQRKIPYTEVESTGCLIRNIHGTSFSVLSTVYNRQGTLSRQPPFWECGNFPFLNDNISMQQKNMMYSNRLVAKNSPPNSQVSSQSLPIKRKTCFITSVIKILLFRQHNVSTE